MSLTKRLLELGWTPIGKAICCECVANPALRVIVEENLAFDKCDYCGKTGEEIAADTDVVMEHIEESIETEWTDPANELPYETAEGGYQAESRQGSSAPSVTPAPAADRGPRRWRSAAAGHEDEHDRRRSQPGSG